MGFKCGLKEKLSVRYRSIGESLLISILAATEPVVDNLNPANHRLSGFITGSPFPPVIKLGLQCRPERLGHRVVKADTSSADRLRSTLLLADLSQ